MQKEVGSGGADLKREDDQPLSQAGEEDIENHGDQSDVSKLEFLLNKIKQTEEAGKHAQYYTLKNLFKCVYEECASSWDSQGVDKVIEYVNRFSYLGAFRQYLRQNHYDV